MQYLHIKKLDKYHIDYKDRPLRWAKIYFNMVQGDPDCEMITNETDWARLIKFIILELQAQKPIPLDPIYLQKKGFDLSERCISLTISSLQHFIEVRNGTGTKALRKRVSRVEESRVEKSRVEKKGFQPPTLPNVKTFFKNDTEAEKFYDHFQSNGWKVGGKAPMKDWQAAARNWLRRINPRKPDGVDEWLAGKKKGAKDVKQIEN